MSCDKYALVKVNKHEDRPIKLILKNTLFQYIREK